MWQPSNQWTDLDSTRFFYDGWNVIEEHTITAGTQTLARTFTWGSDLSGTLQGAGGVGGLLLAEEVSGGNTTARHYHYDGNGNVTEITDLAGAKVASYRYDAYGNTLAATGPYSAQNRYRFSTKPLDSEVTGAPLYYYGYRYYDPITGSWPSRDPIEEEGGVNLYGMVANDPVNRWDVLGLKEGSGTECCDEKTISEGKKKLTEVYEKTHKQWEADGVPHRGEDDNSCFNLNSQILVEFTPIPKCWECKLENGRTDPQGGWGPFFRKVYDHWVVVCKATAQDGSEAGEISFDYWANRPAGEDPNDWFRKRYKNPGEPDWDPPQFHRVCGSKKLVIK